MRYVRVPPVVLLAAAGAVQWALSRNARTGGAWEKAAAVTVGAVSVGMLGRLDSAVQTARDDC